jgi:hypothetical protein
MFHHFTFKHPPNNNHVNHVNPVREKHFTFKHPQNNNPVNPVNPVREENFTFKHSQNNNHVNPSQRRILVRFILVTVF